MRKNPVKNQKGQVALFVALIFQVLFVFFAMIVNVGLLVHHKINLQNSVDLAAYYGAMKQAQMLNAVAHVNYQIRQAWKLLSYRTNVFGTAGAITQNPYKPGPPPQFTSQADVFHTQPMSYCVAYTPVTLVSTTESYCQQAGGMDVPLPGIPILGPGNIFVVFQTGLAAAATALRNAAQSSCEKSMAGNFRQLAVTIGTYKSDIRNRKKLLISLANEMSKADPSDIDGESVRTGVFRTLYKNLTSQNRDSLRSRYSEAGAGAGNAEVNFNFINSLSMGGCDGGLGSDTPPKWLAEQFVFPVHRAVDADCSNTSNLQFRPYPVNVGSTVAAPPNAVNFFGNDTAQALTQFMFEQQSSDPKLQLYRTSVGFEKSPWCVAYVGVSATATPKIPFTPLGDVTMKATAYAKPFGGRIGPWYSRFWDPGAPQSRDAATPAEMNDKLIPIRVKPDQNVTNFDPAPLTAQRRVLANYSRYLGDEIGVFSELHLGQFEQAIFRGGPPGIDLAWWDGPLAEEFDDLNSMGDVLAWNKINNSAPPIRATEISAVAPDQFDTSFYSIDPDFYNNYLTHIQKGYAGKFNFSLRGDIGSRMQGNDDEKKFSVRNQIDTLKTPGNPSVDWQNQVTYYLSEFGQLLTGWQLTNPDNYQLSDEKFGKCDPDVQVQQNDDPKFFTSGSCKAGGRTGYSVKLVDGKFLQNNVNGKPKTYELGGQGVFGNIQNPPPAAF